MEIELIIGDITRQPDLDAVAGAIHRAAGPRLAEACRSLAPIEPGQAVITEAFDLPNRRDIHVLGPRWGIDEPADALLARGHRNALGLCAEHGIASVGFPAISAGAFGYPLEDAANIAVETVRAEAPEGLKVRFVLFDKGAYNAFDRVLSRW